MIQAEESSPYPSTSAAFFRLLLLKRLVGYAVAAPPRTVLAEMMSRWSPEDISKFKESAVVQRDKYWGPLEQLEHWEQLASPREREIAASTFVTMTAQEQTDSLWRIEAIQVLLWALGKLDALPPIDSRASMDLLRDIPNGPSREYAETLRPRARTELESARADAELWHWRSRTRQLVESGAAVPVGLHEKGIHTFDDIVRITAEAAAAKQRLEVAESDFAVSGKPYRSISTDDWSMVRSITVERHFTLNWLCGHAPGNRWDETPTGT